MPCPFGRRRVRRTERVVQGPHRRAEGRVCVREHRGGQELRGRRAGQGRSLTLSFSRRTLG